MTVDIESLARWQSGAVRQRYDGRDCALYALGVGLGMDPLDALALPFLDPTSAPALPTLATVLASPGVWLAGFAASAVVHAAQSLVLHRPLAAAGAVVSTTRVTALARRRAGLFVTSERRLADAESGEVIATMVQTSVLLGADAGPLPSRSEPPEPLPARAPDAVAVLPTSPQAALIYRLSGDTNPIHSDPAVARAAGFPRPILHGLATFGLIGWALVRTLAGGDGAGLRALSGRFTAPVFPGERVRVEIWRERGAVRLRAQVPARGVVVFDAGRAEIGG